MDGITELVEKMSAHFGSELAFACIVKQPCILDVPFEIMLERCEKVKANIGYRESDMPLVLAKEPKILWLDSNIVKERFQALPRVLNLPQQQVRTHLQCSAVALNNPCRYLYRQLCKVHIYKPYRCWGPACWPSVSAAVMSPCKYLTQL
jgi:hypothetical protein